MCQLQFGIVLFSSAQPSFSRWYHLLAPRAVVFVALSLHPHSVGYITVLILERGELRLKQRKGLTKFTQKRSSNAGREAKPSYLSSIALPGITEKPLAESSCMLGCSSQIFCLLGFAQKTKSQCSFCSPGNPHVTRMGRVSSECSSQAAFSLRLCHSLVCVQRLLTHSHVAEGPAGVCASAWDRPLACGEDVIALGN